MSSESYNIDGWLDLGAFARAEQRRISALPIGRAALSHHSASLAKVAIVMVLVVMVFKGAFIESFVIPSGSMTPTLKESDYILVPKFLYGLHAPLLDDALVMWGGPERGDVIVFKHPNERQEALPSSTLVKRVIAREGDTIEVVGQSVYLNGRELIEPYARWSDVGVRPDRIGPLVVPPGEVFVLGDNRAHSEDSRAWSDPFVPVSAIIGKAVMVYWSDSGKGRAGTLL